MSPNSRQRMLALGLTAALGATACAGGESSAVTTTEPDVPEAAVETAPAEDNQPQDEPEADDSSPSEDTAAPPAEEPEPEPEEAPAAPPAGEPEAEPEAAEPEEEAEPAGENQLPEVAVIDINTGEEVILSSFAPADRPIVLWFWAPH